MSDEAAGPATPAPVAVTPAPSDEEMAAIVAGVDALWPRPVAITEPPPAPRWRFAGRWWNPRPRWGGWR